MEGGIVTLGWREWVALPELGIPAMRAKLDTGARSSSLHVDEIETFVQDGMERVRFVVATGEAAGLPAIAEAPVLERRPVTDSGGHRTERIFIRTALALAGRRYPAEINLTSRRNMLFPMLLGRTALVGRFAVDPGRSFVLGKARAGG